jgi:prepilin-type N-terminal cleavage/methylation domain-containing protein
MMRRGLTILELLAVIAIIALLAGMVLGVSAVVRENATKQRVRAGIQLVRSALEARANSGALITPVAHPFANTSASVGAGRAVFIRSGTAGFSAGAAVSRSGSMAIEVDDPLWIASAERTRVLRHDDAFEGLEADGDAPHLRGLTRRELSVLGTAAGLIDHIRLPNPGVMRWADRNNDGVLDTPYDFSTGAYQRSQWWAIEAGDLTTNAVEQNGPDFWNRILGPETADELTKIRFLRTSPTTWPLGAGNRVRLPPESAVDPVGASLLVAGTARPYRLRGVAMYDAWGTEIISYLDDDKRLIIESAGKDGHFRRLGDGTPAIDDNIRDPSR